MARQRRRQPLNYDSRKAGGLNATNFGDIAKTFTEGQRYIREVAERTDKKIQDNVNAVMESTDYEYIGQPDIDKASADMMNGIRNDLFNEKAKIGIDGYSVHDFNKVYNKSMNSAKTFGGLNEFAKKQLESINGNENLSDIVKDGFLNNIGAAFSKDGKYRMDVKGGDILMTTYSEDEEGNVVETPTDLKRFMINGQDEIEKFDALGSVSEFQKVYMERDQEYLGVTFQEVEANGGLWADTVTRTDVGPRFKTFLDAHIDNFSKSDDAIAYAYDTMGLKLGRDISQRDGKFILSEEQRKEIGQDYRKMIEGQMGIKEDGSGRYIPAPRPVSGGSGKDPGVLTTFSFAPDNNLADGPAKEWNKGSTLAAITSSLTGQTISSIGSGMLDGQLNDAVEKMFEDDAQRQEFKARNSDLYYYINGKPTPTKSEDLEFTAVGISADMQSQDLTELSISSSNDRPFSNISGIMVVEREVKLYNSETNETVTVKQPFFRLRGNVVRERSLTTREIEARGGQMIKDGVKVSSSENRSLMTTEFSDPLNDENIEAVIRSLSKANPSFLARYRTALSVAQRRDKMDVTNPSIRRNVIAKFLKSMVKSPVIK
jgi:hypothetical protein